MDAATFAALMARFTPFEPAPVVAVGLSGGADSLCLVHLADAWARDQGGHALALIVDHGLRPDSGEEARQVAGWMAAAGIAHRVLTAAPTGRAGNVQAAARTDRLALLEEQCRQEGVLHLLLAHHRDDQAETLLQRLARGSGAHGLAAMTPEKSFRHVRVLRPFLDVAKDRLAATLKARGLPWIEDPSNRNPRFDRVRLRQALATLATADPLLSARLAHTAGAMRRTRRILDHHIDALLARAVALSPLGYAEIDAAALDGADRDLAARALGLLVATVGAAPHPPRREAMLRWLALIADPAGGGATLAGAQLTRWRNRWFVHREAAAVAPPVTVSPGTTVHWDGRFACTLHPSADRPVTIGAWSGQDSPVESESPVDDPLWAAIPRPVQPTLPVARVLDGPPFIPHLNAGRKAQLGVYWAVSVTFSPLRPLTDPVSPGGRIRIGG